jgi:hypothetical protein
MPGETMRTLCSVLFLTVLLISVGCGQRTPSAVGISTAAGQPTDRVTAGVPPMVPSEPGGATVTFVKAEIGPMSFETTPSTPFPQYLKVWLKVDAKKRTHVRAWSLGPQSEAVLTDDGGRKYTFIADADYNNMGGHVTLNPGETLPMLLLFEPPDSRAKRLSLRLNGRGLEGERQQPLGPDKDIKLEIKGWK